MICGTDGDKCPAQAGAFLLDRRQANRYNEDVIGGFF